MSNWVNNHTVIQQHSEQKKLTVFHIFYMYSLSTSRIDEAVALLAFYRKSLVCLLWWNIYWTDNAINNLGDFPDC